MGDLKFPSPGMGQPQPLPYNPQKTPQVIAPRMIPTSQQTNQMIRDVAQFVAETIDDLRQWALGQEPLPRTPESAPNFASPQSAQALDEAQRFLQTHSPTP